MAKSDKDFLALTKAVSADDVAKVEKLVGKVDADAMPCNLVGHSLLMSAVKHDAPLEIIKLLVERGGAKLDYKGKRGETPISFALELEREDVIEYFASRGADIKLVEFKDLPQAEKNRRLARTCGEWYSDTCAARMKQMIDDGADPNALVDGDTPLLRIAGQGDLPDLFALLLAAGADPEVAGAGGDTPLHKVAQFGNVTPLTLFVDAGVPIDSRDGTGATPLHRAVSGGHRVEKVVELLLERGADVHAKDKAGKTPIDVAIHPHKDRLAKVTAKPLDKSTEALFAAVVNNDAGEVGRLLDAGANPSAVDASGKEWWRSVSGVAALHLAFTRDVGREVADRLLAHPGIDINVRSVADSTPLHYLTRWGQGADRIALAKRLLALGADANAVDDGGWTPLLELTSFYKLDGEPELFDLLVAAGADPRRPNKHGDTMLDQMFERTMRFEEINDKPGFVQMMTKLVDAKVPCARGKHVVTWLATKGVKYGTAAPAAPAKAATASKARAAFKKITGGKLAKLVGKATYLKFGKTKKPVALFDWFAFTDQQDDDKHTYIDQIFEHHVPEEARANVDAETWIPFGVIGITEILDRYEEIADGVLFLDLGAAKAGDAPVVVWFDEAEKKKPVYSALIATLTTKA